MHCESLLENGSSDSSKVFNESIRKENATSPVGKYKSTRSRISTEERRQFYISEAELQLHEQIALWARSAVCSAIFLCMKCLPSGQMPHLSLLIVADLL